MSDGGDVPFGALLRRLRQGARLTQEELAERAGVSVRGISDLERGVNRTARRETSCFLADALGLSGETRFAFLDAARGRPPAPIPPLGRLPTPLTPLIGRAREMAAVLDLLGQPHVRLVTLTGAGGAGKTRLALEIAARAAARFPDGVRFVDLAPLADPALVAAAVAQELGVTEQPTWTLPESVIAALADKRLLLVLDNFEHLLDAASLVTTLLGRCPGLIVLATSRSPLRLRGEHVFEAPPLPLPDPRPGASLETLAGNEAVTLFSQRAQEASSGFALSADNVEAIAEVCRRLDGLPLAIELAAARVPSLSPAAIVAGLETPLALLTTGPRDVADRQRTLRNTIDWSYQLLDPGERVLFRRLAVFAADATPEAIAAVAGDGSGFDFGVRDDTAKLVEQGLVRQTPPAGPAPRLRMLETIREYARERLGESDEAEAIHRAHARYFLALAERVEPELTRPNQAVWLAAVDAERDNLRAALRWAVDAREDATAVRLAGALWGYWEIRGLYAEGQTWLERVLAAGEQDDVPIRDRARAVFGAGALAYRRRDLERSERRLTEALGLFRMLNDPGGEAGCLAFLGLVMLVQGRLEEAEGFHEAALAVARAAEDGVLVAGTLSNLGEVAHARGDRERAEALYEESLAAGRALPNPLAEARALTNLAVVAVETGRHGRAAALHREGLRIYRDLGDRRGIASSLEGLGAAAVDQPHLAARLYGAASALRDITGSPVPAIEQRAHERGIAAARARLGEAAFAQAWAEGRAADLDAVVAEALSMIARSGMHVERNDQPA